MEMSESQRSAALHARVRTFIGAAGIGPIGDDRDFEVLALDLFRHQWSSGGAYRRLCDGAGIDPEQVTRWHQVPSVSTDLWKVADFCTFDPRESTVCFQTSGTTQGVRGRHHLRDRETYRASLRPWMDAFLLGGRPLAIVSLIAPWPTTPDSSLAFMIDDLVARHPDAVVACGATGLDLETAAAALRTQARNGAPTLLLSTARALQALIEGPLRHAPLRLAPGSRVMETGGWKGASASLPTDGFYAAIERQLGIPGWAIVSEYGMTELGSQGYHPGARLRFDPTFARGFEGLGARGPRDRDGSSRLLVFPPWCRVSAIDPDTLQILPEGAPGLLRFFDLSNVDSVLAVQTADLGACWGAGVQWLGRAPGATARGCSLRIDELLAARGTP